MSDVQETSLNDILWKRVSIGDVVRLKDDRGTFVTDNYVVRIVDRTMRFGTGSSDLFKGKILDGKPNPFPHTLCKGDKEDQFSFAGHFIAEIVKHPKGATMQYRHHNGYRPGLKRITHTDSRGMLFGPFDCLVNDIISTMPNLTMSTTISMSKAWALFGKTKPGFVTFEHIFDSHDDHPFSMEGWIRVRRKPFKNWLIQNINRMQYTRKELDEMEDQYNKEMYEELDRDFEDAIKSVSRSPRTIGDLIVVELARQFCDEFANMTYDEADYELAKVHLEKLSGIELTEAEIENLLAPIGAKCKEFERRRDYVPGQETGG